MSIFRGATHIIGVTFPARYDRSKNRGGKNTKRNLPIMYGALLLAHGKVIKQSDFVREGSYLGAEVGSAKINYWPLS